MPLYKVTFYSSIPVKRSVFIEDELDELDDDDIEQDAWFKLQEYLKANDEETSGWEDPEVRLVE